MSKREAWSFSHEAAGWHWLFRDTKDKGPEIRSIQAFPTLLECIRDAMDHGYAIVDPRSDPHLNAYREVATSHA